MIRKTRSIETVGSNSSFSKLQKKASSFIGKPEPKDPQEVFDEERYKKLREGRKAVTRDVLAEYFQLDLSPYFQNKLFDVLKIDGDVDLAGFRRLTKVLEARSATERQKVAFGMFDPNGQGRITKNDFKKTAAELLAGATKQFPLAPSGASSTPLIKTIVQAIADTVYSVYCTDDQRGMDMKEWINYASEDVEVCRLVSALDKSIQWSETVIRHRIERINILIPEGSLPRTRPIITAVKGFDCAKTMATQNNVSALETRLAELKSELHNKNETLRKLKNVASCEAKSPTALEPSSTLVTNEASLGESLPDKSSSLKARTQFRSKRTGAAAGQTSSVDGSRRPSSNRSAANLEMPRDLVENEALDQAIASSLPGNYNFEIKKTLWRIRRSSAKKVAIQFPEGLLLFACPISDLLAKFGGVEVFIFADVTYGACCVDDFAARALGCELLVHYGHSCLVPVDITSVSPSKEEPGTTQVMYVFVDVNFDIEHMVESIKLEFPDTSTRLAVLGTIQFSGSLHAAKLALDKFYAQPVMVPQAKPLSSGEVLGCTSPTLPEKDLDAFIFVADGRFHLESAMIANPALPALRYDPYSKGFSKEAYDSPLLLNTRLGDINRAKGARKWGIVLGTLGRQGNPAILRRVKSAIVEARSDASVLTVLLSELSPAKLKAMEEEVEAWVQIACPRLSVDWAEAFSKKPLLTPYECFVAMGKTQWRESIYPQDFYSKGSGPWTNYYEEKA